MDRAALARQGTRREIRERQLREGRWLEEIERTRAYRRTGCASIAGYGETQGYSAEETRQMIRAARASAIDPRVEGYLLEGRLHLDAAALLMKAWAIPPREGVVAPDWVERATQVPARRLRDEISEHAARVRHPTPPVRVTGWLSADAMRRYLRAHRLLMRREKTILSDGDVIGLLADFFVKKHDRAGLLGSRRRIPSTRGRPGRYVAASVDRAVRLRDDDRCAVGLCPNDIWVDRAHVVPHRDGGDREEENLAILCPAHNQMCETGELALHGSASDLVCLDREKRVILRSRRPLERRPTFDEWLAKKAGTA